MNKSVVGFYLSIGALISGGMLITMIMAGISANIFVYGLLALLFLICTYPAFLLCLFGIFKRKDLIRNEKKFAWAGFLISGVFILIVFYIIYTEGKVELIG
ncbi:hypothetical protein I6J18_17295 [Peribacillus psychrosaccharolyticus]|uniref:Uncharacterized protein n=1 Tax=Peribacillus psychrosaccharolyticus TaxID=1407 RepID=A0A974NKF7_PERPY|nr:hypothetical protein [Peribacillus psychrosaccharolyticus]MEC2055714.1 hypothetical protein [Peribacillus psychrosaccharolyticus]MED3743259.1 hypothetical protein [Peribacillus psychrosaccharolyticus]QQS99370.1 hypothetical protein I6J18_17295 [Peribacillus psychrosaccharolyticus]